MTSLKAFPAIANTYCHTLILGSMPGVQSLNQQQYYAHPRNAFWSIMQAITGVDADANYNLRCQALLQHGIALWDVLASCRRIGSLDSAIEKHSIIVNDFAQFFSDNDKLQQVLLNGGAANQLFQRHVVKPGLCPKHIDTHACPSTSPAHARLNIDQKKQHWLKHFLDRQE